MLAKGEYNGALEMALKTQDLYPHLHNISRLMAIYEALVKKQYKKLALLLHPHKANIVGAKATFKLIGEAKIMYTARDMSSIGQTHSPNQQTLKRKEKSADESSSAKTPAKSRSVKRKVAMKDLNDEHIDDVAPDGNIHYPDHPEFNDFEKDRTENSFVVGQVWALYDDIDGMPRFYVRVDNITSHGFKLMFTWLELNSIVDVALLVSCGHFVDGNSQEIENHFVCSHHINFTRNAKGDYVIYPRKDETWALYKKWNMTRGRNLEERSTKYEFQYVEDGLEEDVKAGEFSLIKIDDKRMKHIVKKEKRHEEQCDHTDVEQNDVVVQHMVREDYQAVVEQSMTSFKNGVILQKN
ncbi:hypothetical protein ACFE04_019466 [Oxalis oulophora]